MFHINKLQDLGIITFALQKICTHSICDQRRHPFFQDSIAQNRLQHFIFTLFINFMLTAGYGKNDFSSPFHCLGKCIIGSCVTGMKRYHHIHTGYTFIICNITMIEMQLLISVSECQRITFLNYICFQVKTYDIYIISF